MNRETFLRICPHISKEAKPHNDDRIYSRRFAIDDYDYDYSHAIVKYMEACGCVIKRTNWNVFGGFYVDYLGSTKYISPEEFLETYVPGRHYDSRTKTMFWVLGIPTILVIILFIGTFIYRQYTS